MVKIDVILCTHNPHLARLMKVLESLRIQSLEHACWSLTVIDNASKEPLNSLLDLSWKSNAAVIREESLGLTAARLRGICETDSDLIVFVDDDNVLAPNYLEEALNLSDTHSDLGAWGGQVLPHYESALPKEIAPHVNLLAIREFSQEQIQQTRDASFPTPCGAGLILKRKVALTYADRVSNDPLRKSLDRKGNSLSSAGDTDMVWMAWELGFHVGLFPSLVLTHVIPATRLKVDYIVSLYEAMYYSGTMLKWVYGEEVKEEGLSRKIRTQIKNLAKPAIDRRLYRAVKRGTVKARKEIKALQALIV